jgi:hypothetical protein
MNYAIKRETEKETLRAKSYKRKKKVSKSHNVTPKPKGAFKDEIVIKPLQ